MGRTAPVIESAAELVKKETKPAISSTVTNFFVA
jgi:hypothetical protein